MTTMAPRPDARWPLAAVAALASVATILLQPAVLGRFTAGDGKIDHAMALDLLPIGSALAALFAVTALILWARPATWAAIAAAVRRRPLVAIAGMVAPPVLALAAFHSARVVHASRSPCDHAAGERPTVAAACQEGGNPALLALLRGRPETWTLPIESAWRLDEAEVEVGRALARGAPVPRPAHPPLQLRREGGGVDWQGGGDPALAFALTRLEPLALAAEATPSLSDPELRAAATLLIERSDAHPTWPRWDLATWNDDATSARVLTALTLERALRRRGLLDAALQAGLVQALLRDIRWLQDVRYVNRRSNHGMMQHTALLTFAVAMPELDPGGRARRLAIDRMRDHMQRAVSPAGSFREAAAGYHLFGTRLLASFVAVARTSGAATPELEQILDRMLGVAGELVHPDLSLPFIGDTGPWRYDCRSWPWAALPAGPGALLARQRLAPDASPKSAGHFVDPEVGYAVLRGADVGAASQLVATLMAGRYVTSHGHDDKLALTLFARGRALLSGPGYPDYFDAAYRNEHISTRHHSTASLQHESTAGLRPTSAAFLLPEAATRVQAAPMEAQLIVAERRSTPTSAHRRALLLGPTPGALVVVDALQAPAAASWAVRLRLADDLRAEIKASATEVLDAAGRRLLRIRCFDPDHPDVPLRPVLESEGRLRFEVAGGDRRIVTVLEAPELPADVSVQPGPGPGLLWRGPSGQARMNLSSLQRVD